MQSEIDETDSLRQRIAKLEAENNKIKAENNELKARVVRLEDKRFFLSRFEKKTLVICLWEPMPVWSIRFALQSLDKGRNLMSVLYDKN